jgi:AraC family transcriptional regulator
MSLQNDRTSELWRTFRSELPKSPDFENIEMFNFKIFSPPFDLATFKPDTIFTKWAAIAESENKITPPVWEILTVLEGLYAVFEFNGAAAEFAPALSHIYGVWLPNSEFLLDDRPHFEVLPPSYHPFNVSNQEEIWIPVKLK